VKIIQVVPEMHAGGVERGTLEIANYLADNGCESVVVSNGGRLVERLASGGSRHIGMPVHRKSPLSLMQVAAMRRLLEREKPDVLHYRSRVPGWICLLAWRTMAVSARPRLVSTVHGFHSVGFYSSVMSRGERVIAVSQSIREHLLRDYPQVDPAVIRVIPRGIDPACYHPGYAPDEAWLSRWRGQVPPTAGTGEARLLLPGRITRLKGHEDFLRMVAALRAGGCNARALLAGDTHPKKLSYRAEIEALANSLGLAGHVDFLGHRGDLREVMTQCDVVFSLSRQREAFGRTVLEALALGKPVVGYDCGGVGELLAALFPAGRVPPGDTARLLDVARHVLDARPLPAAVGPPFTLDRMCAETLRVYQELSARCIH